MSAPTVEVIIPYRSRGDDRACDFTVARWRATGATVSVVDSTGTTFNRSRARNLGAAASNADVLIFANADTVHADAVALRFAIASAVDGQWSLPYLYVETREEQAAVLLAGDPEAAALEVPEDPHRVRLDSPAGPQIISAADHALAGGWDEGFTDWGWEDTAYRAAVDTLVRPHIRLGNAVHLWHPPAADAVSTHPGYLRSRARWKLYQRAERAGRPAMRRLITQRKAIR